MTGAWNQWEGHIVNEEFQLQKCLGSSERSAVFLTAYRGREPQQATIKLIAADAANAELQLHRWEVSERLSHPHLIQLLRTGRCRLSAIELIFVVMEYAEENLGQILPERPLTPAEAHEMLEPTLDAIAYLHRQGLVHGGLKPANVMATGDQLKLASDRVCKAGERLPNPGKSSAYDPPERGTGMAVPAADIWSLGMTLAEVLTQHLPSWEAQQKDPVLPEDLPAPFFDIVRGCLRRDPGRRWTIDDIAARLHPAQVFPQERKPVSSQQGTERRRFVVGGAVAALALATLLTGLRLLHHQPESVTSALKPEQKPKPQEAGRRAGKPSDQQPGSHGGQAEPVPRAKPSPAFSPSDIRATTNRHAPIGSVVVHRSLPDVPQSALDTIHGTVMVSVRIQVDRSGNVVGSEFEYPGPSKYFAGLAMQSAQSWRFAPYDQDNRRQFILRFEFRENGTSAFVTPAVP